LKNNFKETLKNYKAYLNSAVPEIGSIQTYWDDPLKSTKTRSILLPLSHSVSDVLSFSIELFVFVIDKNYEAITDRQLEIMEKIFTAVYDFDAPDSGKIDGAEYFPPVLETPNIGTLRVIIKLDIDYIDDCF